MTGSKPRSSVVLSDFSATCATNATASIKQILLYFTLILVAVINVTNARWSLPQPTAAHLHLAALTEKVTISKKFHPFFYLGMSYRFEPFLPESLLDLFWRSRHLPRRRRRRRRRCVGNIFFRFMQMVTRGRRRRSCCARFKTTPRWLTFQSLLRRKTGKIFLSKLAIFNWCYLAFSTASRVSWLKYLIAHRG